MEFARLTFSDNTFQHVTLPRYLRMKADDPTLDGRVTCPDPKCGHRVHPYNVGAAQTGFQIVNHEVTLRYPDRLAPLVGFSHYPGQYHPDCKYLYAHDERYKGEHDSAAFMKIEREHSAAAMNVPGRREAIQSLQNYFMQRLAGPREAWKDKADFNKAERDMVQKVGFSHHPWILAFAGLMKMPPQPVRVNGETFYVCYRPHGHQQLPFTGHDGQRRILEAPRKMVGMFAPAHDRTNFEPIIESGGRGQLAFDVSRQAAARYLKTAHALNKA